MSVAEHDINGKGHVLEMYAAVSCWMACSISMMLANNAVVSFFPQACLLSALQLFFTVSVLGLFFPLTIYFGSTHDVLRWSRVIPFFSGMLVTSFLALQHASMTLIVIFRSLSPIFALILERFLPHPVQISPKLMGYMALMISGTVMYVKELEGHGSKGIMWVLINVTCAVIERTLQRSMLAKDQYPVDISKTGCIIISNLGSLPVLALAAYLTGEFSELPTTITKMQARDSAMLLISCALGCGISYTGTWAQSKISATTFLMLVVLSKFSIIFIEATALQLVELSPLQTAGAMLTIFASIGYSRERQLIEDAIERSGELQALKV
eukprot:CAMPEP_0197656890 /NCGR_PEP_ID=MMETSP1338-20131121/43840_1 /TAXON_ID=43686 ORGANISM="Pelagodinium beii, Strain RCC1491" /NCGR_SAMPLE_ID=MMETSP1338 /ASSEMBLY_ACC=CAM_ASM_000754 /LENGTH=324 /DNA_ID=CAMNT_0043233111 /DNA_START=44 /DNA_END=1018 /DNA_ORIENTATION=-